MQHEHYTHTAPDIPSSTALSIFFFLLHFLLMQLLFLLLVLFQDFLHNLLSILAYPSVEQNRRERSDCFFTKEPPSKAHRSAPGT